MVPHDECAPARRSSRATRSTALSLALLAACAGASRNASTAPYQARTRAITITTVPLLVREDAAIYPFLKQDFAKGGVLDGKEVYAFSPSSVTAVEGDTIHFTFINPEDDVHSFVVADLSILLPPQKVTEATWIARKRGIYPIECSVASHLPMMSGQLVVLAPDAMAEPVRAAPGS